MDIENILESGGVMRYHATPCIPNQSLADHQWRVGLLLKHFYPNMGPHVLVAALTHDSAEMQTGDTPSYAKKAEPALKRILDKMEDEIAAEWGILSNLNITEKIALKYCDVIEGLLYCHNQVISGNRKAIKVFDNWVIYYHSLNVDGRHLHIKFVTEKALEVDDVR